MALVLSFTTLKTMDDCLADDEASSSFLFIPTKWLIPASFVPAFFFFFFCCFFLLPRARATASMSRPALFVFSLLEPGSFSPSCYFRRLARAHKEMK